MLYSQQAFPFPSRKGGGEGGGEGSVLVFFFHHKRRLILPRTYLFSTTSIRCTISFKYLFESSLKARSKRLERTWDDVNRNCSATAEVRVDVDARKARKKSRRPVDSREKKKKKKTFNIPRRLPLLGRRNSFFFFPPPISRRSFVIIVRFFIFFFDRSINSWGSLNVS